MDDQLTYRDAGVDIDAGMDAVEKMKEAVRRTSENVVISTWIFRMPVWMPVTMPQNRFVASSLAACAWREALRSRACALSIFRAWPSEKSRKAITTFSTNSTKIGN